MVNLVSQMSHLFHGQPKCDNSMFVYLQRYYHRFHTWTFFFMNWWNVIFEGLSSWKASITKPTLERCFPLMNTCNVVFKLSFVLKSTTANSHLNDLFLSWTEDMCDLTEILAEKCVSQISHLNIFFFMFFQPLVFKNLASHSYITVQWFFSSTEEICFIKAPCKENN